MHIFEEGGDLGLVLLQLDFLHCRKRIREESDEQAFSAFAHPIRIARLITEQRNHFIDAAISRCSDVNFVVIRIVVEQLHPRDLSALTKRAHCSVNRTDGSWRSVILR